MRGDRSVLIFGAGINQWTLIDATKSLGLTTVVLDPNPEAPGREIADFFYAVGGKDYETTKGIALKHKVRGLVTSQMEKPLKLMARLAQELSLSFHTPEVVERGTDKYLMKQAFLANGVPCANGVLVRRDDKVDDAVLKTLALPLILKPRDATSSQGVYRIDDYADITKYIEVTRSFSTMGDVLIEEFIDGPEFSVESITYKGRTTIVQYTEKFITPFPHTVELAHLQPASLTEVQKASVDDVVRRAVKAIGIDNSASHTELKITKDGPKIIEIGPRLGGDFISSYLVLHSCGVNMDRAAVQVAIGIEPDLKATLNQISMIKYLELPPSRTVAKVNGWEHILDEPGVVFADVNLKPGDVTSEITESSKRPGFVVVSGNNREATVSCGEMCTRKLAGFIDLA